MMNLTYNLASGTWLTPSGTSGTDWTPELNFGEAPEMTITIQGLPQGIALATAWQVAVAKDWQSSTSPMCRTTDDITCAIEGNNATFTFIVDTATERFLKVVDGKGEGVLCSMQIVGISDGTPCCFVTMPWLCRPALDPHGSAGPLPPIPTTNMSKAEVEAIAEDAAEAAVEGELANYYTKTEADNLLDGKIGASEKGVADGVATLDGNGKVPSGQLPEATSSAYGAVKLNASYGVKMATSSGESIGYLATNPASTAQLSARTNQFCPIVPNTLNYAVTAALTDENHITLTDEQKSTAQGVFGVPGLDSNGKIAASLLPIATSDTIGAVIINSNFGIEKSSSGRLNIVGASTTQITNRGGTYSPITPNRLNYAVTAALTDANHITLTAAQQATARGVLGIDGTTSITALTGGSGTVEPGKVYTLTMTTDFTLSASSVASGIYGESVLFVVPNTYAFSVASGITLDAEMIAGLRYRLLISWTPFGVHAEQTAEWEA